jgi:membrane protease YdiL (CAAX protease family)
MSETDSRLSRRPLLSILLLIILYAVIIVFIAITSAILSLNLILDFAFALTVTGFLWLILVPFVLHLPNGRASFREYLDSIRLIRFKPITRTITFGFVGILIFSLVCLITALIYGDWEFDPSRVIEPESLLILTAIIPGVWEEVAFRGVILALLLRKFDERTSIVFDGLLFGFGHAIRLLFGADIIFTIGQMIYASCLGAMLAFLLIRTDSLLPCIMIHYFANSFGAIFLYRFFELPIDPVYANGLLTLGSIVSSIVGFLVIETLSRYWRISEMENI